MYLQIVTVPTLMPITLTETKQQLRINPLNTVFDSMINGYIVTATREAEKFMRRKLLSQTWSMFFDKFPCSDYFINIPFGGLNTIISFSYKNETGAVTIVNPATYIEDVIGNRLVLAYEEDWPDVELYPSNPIEIRFECGYLLPSLVPQEIKDAIKIKVSDLFINSNDVILSNMLFISRLNSFERLLWPHKVHTRVNI